MQNKCKIPEFTHARRKVPITYTPTYWIWLNVDIDDLRWLSNRSTCVGLFTSDWEYCQRYGINNLAEMKAYQSSSAQQTTTSNVTPISSRTRKAPTRRKLVSLLRVEPVREVKILTLIQMLLMLTSMVMMMVILL